MANTLIVFAAATAVAFFLGGAWKHNRIMGAEVQNQRTKLWKFRRMYWVDTMKALARAGLAFALVLWLTINFHRAQTQNTEKPLAPAVAETSGPKPKPSKTRTVRPYIPVDFGK